MQAAAGYTITEIMSGLVTPRGLAFGPDGALYVSTFTNLPLGGQVLRIAAVPKPGSWGLLSLGLAGLAAKGRLRNRLPSDSRAA